MPLPGGTVTFLFTDIEGSTRLWETAPEAMRSALERHDALLRTAIEQNDGHIFKTMGDAFCAAFATAVDALNAALLAQQRLQEESWPDPVTLRVRMALHTGGASLRDNDYFGQPLNRVARLLNAGHGGQILLSVSTQELVRDTLPPLTGLRSLGEHRLRDLDRAESVFQLLHSDLPIDFPPLNSLNNLTLPNNLPPQRTSFIGREKEMAEIKGLLARTPLLTLTGSGGAGKTRISLQVATEVLEEYPDGTWLVELASLSDPALVPQTVASALDLPEQTGKSFTQMVTEHLKTRVCLLLLDNCEHVLNACSQLSDALLRHCPHVRILASSREGLGIAGEQTYRLPSLSLPDLKQTATVESISQYEAVRLFVERATLCKTDFAVTNANAPALASACHRLDGIPLAIELAAARVRSLTIEEINSKLDNRFRLLTGGSKTALPRQQTLAAAIGWSYDLLNAQERTLLARLSVFLGGWTLAAAEAVGAGEEIEDWEALDLLSSLVDKSLVLTEAKEGHTRYRLLETVRQYARDRLVQTEDRGQAARQRHRDYFLKWVEENLPKLKGPEKAHYLNALETEHDNLRLALLFCREEPEGSPGWETQAGLRLGAALQQFWGIRGHVSEGREQLNALLTHPAARKPTQARADALHKAGRLAVEQGDYKRARSLQVESLRIARDLRERRGIANALKELGALDMLQGDYGLAHARTEESLTIWREIGDQDGVATVLGSLGNLAATQGDFRSALSLYEAALAIHRELGNQSGMAYDLSILGEICATQDDYAPVRALAEESLTIYRELGDRWGIACSLRLLGREAGARGDMAACRLLVEESLAIQREIGLKPEIIQSLGSLGDMALQQGDYNLGRVRFEEQLTLCREVGNRVGTAQALSSLGRVVSIQGEYMAAHSLLEESLLLYREAGIRRGEAYTLSVLAESACFQEDYTAARSLYEQSLTLCREDQFEAGIAACLCDLGSLALQQGDMVAARSLIEESLQKQQETGYAEGMVTSLEACAALIGQAGQESQAVRLWGTAEVARQSLQSPLTPLVQKSHDQHIATARRALEEAVFGSAWADGGAMTLEQATASALSALELLQGILALTETCSEQTDND